MLLRFAALILALAASPFAAGEGRDGPGRLAWLTYVQGTVEFQGVDERRTTTLPDRPLVPGDRVATRGDSRAEISLGTAAVRLDEDSEVAIADLGATSVRLSLRGKAANVALYERLEGERFDLITPVAIIALDQAGEYRVDLVSDSSIGLSVRSGVATVATAGGPISVMAGQRVVIEGRGARATLVSARPLDEFDDWVLEREVQLASQQSPPDDGAYAQNGQWADEPAFGRVWASNLTSETWVSSGLWVSTGFGWIWVGNNRWGGGIHGGRWVWGDQSNRWCWVPPRPQPLPEVVRETHPFGRVTRSGGRDVTQITYGQSTPVATQPSSSWGSGTPKVRTTSGSSSGSRPMGSSGNRSSSSSSSPLSPGSVYSPR